MEEERYNIKAIGQLIRSAFTSQGLRRFLIERPVFQPLGIDLSPEQSLTEMTDRLIDFCRTKFLWSELLTEVQRANPRQFARFRPYTHEKIDVPDSSRSSPRFDRPPVHGQAVDTSALFKLLRKIFYEEEDLRGFLFEHFTGAFNRYIPGVGMSVAIQGLIKYCERQGLLQRLIEVIQHEYPIEYGQFQQALYSPTSKPEASIVINRGVVELRLRGDIALPRPNIDDFVVDLRRALTDYFGLQLEDVFIMEVRQGSIIVRGVFSEKAIEKLSQADPRLLSKEFGIEALEILNSMLIKIDFQRANLRSADLSHTDLRYADLRGVNLEEATLQGSVLRLADLRRADLRKANLQRADLRGANLAEANLTGANLEGARLEEANLEGTDLTLATLPDIDLESVAHDETTRWPTHESSPGNG